MPAPPPPPGQASAWPRRLRTWHRRVAVVVGLQLLAWTVSGLMFTWDPIEQVRGETALVERRVPDMPEPARLVSLDAAWRAAGAPTSSSAALEWQRERWCWVLHADSRSPRLVDARSGERLAELTAAEARRMADARLAAPAAVGQIEHIAAAAGEYRGKTVPAWRVAYDDPEHTAVYVDAWTGEVTAVRTDTWRRFDWFWMLHIMDYDARTDFHHPLLTGAALLGVATSLSGLLLAAFVLRPRRLRGAGRMRPPA